jgi:hypothetical protein
LRDLELTAALLELTEAVAAALAADDPETALARLQEREPLLRELASLPPAAIGDEARARAARLRSLDNELQARLQPALAELGSRLARLGEKPRPAPRVAARHIDRTA